MWHINGSKIFDWLVYTLLDLLLDPVNEGLGFEDEVATLNDIRWGWFLPPWCDISAAAGVLEALGPEEAAAAVGYWWKEARVKSQPAASDPLSDVVVARWLWLRWKLLEFLCKFKKQ